MLPILCGCGGPIPQFIEVDLQGIQNGPNCDICNLLNKTYTLGPYGFYGENCCLWSQDYGSGGIDYTVWVEICRLSGGMYDIWVWLDVTKNYCPLLTHGASIYWNHVQIGPYDCDNLDLEIPLHLDEPHKGGCVGGTCRIRSYPETP